MEINFSADLDGVINYVSGIKNIALKKSVKRSLRDAARAMRQETINQGRQVLNAKVTSLRKKEVMTQKTNLSKNIKEQYAELIVHNKELPLDAFLKAAEMKSAKRRERKVKGVTATIYKGRGPKVIKGSFVAKVKIKNNQSKKHQSVFKRKGKPQYEIQKIFTAKLLDVFYKKEVSERIKNKGIETFYKSMNHHFDYYLKKLGG